MAEPRSDPAKHLDHGFAPPVRQEKERPRTEDERDLATRPGIELNCGHSSHLVNLPLGDNKLYVESIIGSPWECEPCPCQAFGGSFLDCQLQGDFLKDRGGEVPLSPRPGTDGADQWRSTEPPQPGSNGTLAKGLASFCHQVKALPACDFPWSQRSWKPLRRKSA